MLPILVTVLASITLMLRARRANTLFKKEERLPMQWSGQGEVSWTTPRVAALAAMPVLGTLILCVASLSFIFVEPRSGQENMVIPAMLVLALVPIGIQHLHITMMARYLDRTGD